MSQMRTHILEGRKREEWVGELGNVAHHRAHDTECNRPRASSALVSSGTGQYDETFTLSPSRSCMISFGAASCSLMTPPYRCSCLVSFVPFCIGITSSPPTSVFHFSRDTYPHHHTHLPRTIHLS